MSRHERQVAECEGKQRYSREQAKTIAKKLRRKKAKVEAYKCATCGSWHIGAITKKPDLGGPRRIAPTPERVKKGDFKKVGGKAAVERYVFDPIAHPIDALQHSGQISQDQADAGRQFEKLARDATQTPGARDSTTIWEPKGFESDDGNVKAVREWNELYLFLGVVRSRILRRVCVEQESPKLHEIGLLRECLNEVERFFSHGRRIG